MGFRGPGQSAVSSQHWFVIDDDMHDMHVLPDEVAPGFPLLEKLRGYHSEVPTRLVSVLGVVVRPCPCHVSLTDFPWLECGRPLCAGTR